MLIKEPIHSEDAAEQATVTGWCCKKCRRYWGDDERMARYCCATDFPCECGKRYDKGWTCCKDCRDKKAAEKWYAKPAIEWDGEFPLGLWDGDDYFFDADSLLEYIADRAEDDSPDALKAFDWESLWLTPCDQNRGRLFDMNEFLHDDLPEDGELDASEIDATVNAWIEKQGVISWGQSGKRLNVESVKRQLLKDQPHAERGATGKGGE